jgi:thiol:disulfide interchange protein
MKLRSLLIAAGLAAVVCANAIGLPWAKDYKTAVSQAKSGNKVVMLDFTASWCANCHKLDRTTYVDPGVVKLLGGAVPVQIDYDKQPALVKQYKIGPIPVIVFVDAKGKELGRISKYVDAKEFMSLATPVLAKSKRK